MRKKSKTNDMTANVRKAAREATSGTGIPGRRNTMRPVRFATPTDKRAARGRTYRDKDE